MRTACWLVNKNILPFVEPIRDVRKKKASSSVQVSDVTSKLNHNWLKKPTLYDKWPIKNDVTRPVVLKG